MMSHILLKAVFLIVYMFDITTKYVFYIHVSYRRKVSSKCDITLHLAKGSFFQIICLQTLIRSSISQYSNLRHIGHLFACRRKGQAIGKSNFKSFACFLLYVSRVTDQAPVPPSISKQALLQKRMGISLWNCWKPYYIYLYRVSACFDFEGLICFINILLYHLGKLELSHESLITSPPPRNLIWCHRTYVPWGTVALTFDHMTSK